MERLTTAVQVKKLSIGIKDIARLSGVSTATVSRTLSAPDRVSEETRRVVMAVVEQYGYRVNSVARSLRRQRADSVLALLPDLENPFFSMILAGIQQTLLAAGVDLLVTDSRTTCAAGRSPVAHLRASRVDGLICLDGGLKPEILEALGAGDVAGRVVFACEWPGNAEFPSVRSDNRAGMRLAVDHLVGQGHRHIAFLRGPADNVLTRERQAGVEAALAAHSLHLAPGAIDGGDFSLQAGHAAAARLMRLTPRPTAVICSSDQLAIGLMSGLDALGLGVPEDVSVVGFDDIALAAYARPPLTTVRQDRIALGQTAARLLLDRLDGPGAADAPPVITLPVALVTRQSTRPLPG